MTDSLGYNFIYTLNPLQVGFYSIINKSSTNWWVKDVFQFIELPLPIREQLNWEVIINLHEYYTRINKGCYGLQEKCIFLEETHHKLCDLH